MAIIELVTAVRAPVARCFDLSRSIDLHVDSTARTGERAIAGVTSGLIGEGEEGTWQAKHFGVRQRLTSRITAFDPPRYFRDSMVSGAFKRFDHDHYFEAQGDVTLMRDVFDFDSPLGIVGDFMNRAILIRYMRNLLKERHRCIQLVAETEAWKQYLPAE
jgi:ligand-binding SRPBCC domain-containing protein